MKKLVSSVAVLGIGRHLHLPSTRSISIPCFLQVHGYPSCTAMIGVDAGLRTVLCIPRILVFL
jgi:hypothetical protein